MKASLRSVRIAPKKAGLVAQLVRGRPVPEALNSLERTNKKAARLLEQLIKSAVANATNNHNQNPDQLIVKSLVVNKAQAYQRGIPMARGRQRIIRKFLSHITLQLGYPEDQPTIPKAYNPPTTPKKTAAKKPTAKQPTTKKAPAKKPNPPKSPKKPKPPSAKKSPPKTPAKS